MRRYWVNTVSREHVLIGTAGGFTQADHGRPDRLRRLGRCDVLVFYSSRTAMRGGEPLQRFTAIAVIADDEPYQVQMTQTFHPWRRRLDVLQSSEAAAKPLVERLGFVKDPQRWGLPFRRGLFEVTAADLQVIADAMGATVP
ncbi:EVE domain-containing protein [Angustibacter sp. McL0619]|uniref:EVE domain-containing protein n=1 Tax=Angustibacter sp. McL0619 TaxID=3415676 RepID=UPI003CE73758